MNKSKQKKWGKPFFCRMCQRYWYIVGNLSWKHLYARFARGGGGRSVALYIDCYILYYCIAGNLSWKPLYAASGGGGRGGEVPIRPCREMALSLVFSPFIDLRLWRGYITIFIYFSQSYNTIFERHYIIFVDL